MSIHDFGILLLVMAGICFWFFFPIIRPNWFNSSDAMLAWYLGVPVVLGLAMVYA